jgi:alpha-tubulin suppressor-like RCC1 family protein
MHSILRLCGVLLLSLLLSCKDEVVVVVPVASVDVQGPPTLLAGSTAQFRAIPRDDRGNELTNRSINWNSSNGSVATVTPGGSVSGILGGQATISASCDGRTGSAGLQVNNPVPSVSSTEPELPIAGGSAFQMTVRGGGFVQTSEVQWNGDPRPTSFFSGGELRASISATDIAEWGQVAVAVVNPAPGGGSSEGHELTVGYPVPVVDSVWSLTPATYPPPVNSGLIAYGSGFTDVSVLRWNGEDLATTFHDQTELAAIIRTAELEVPGHHHVTVFTPPPGGGTSEPSVQTVEIPVRGPFAAAGLNHSCALDSSGKAYCWGENEDGQLGDGSLTDRATPVPVAGGIEFVALASTYIHTCGLDRVGQAYCWGAGGWGRLGSPEGGSRLEPGPVQGGIPFVSVGAGWDHTCGVAYDGQAYCWGRNLEGELGHAAGPEEWAPAPVDQADLSFRSIAANRYQTCAVTREGAAYCWGDNEFGQLGDGSTQSRDTPVQVPIPGPVVGITVGFQHACAWTEDGRGFCWGDGYSGALGHGEALPSLTPVQVVGVGTWSRIRAGNGFTCGVLDSGQTHCWGSTWRGRLGIGEPGVGGIPSPEPVQGLPGASEIAVGRAHACALALDGRAFCWGGKETGQLGNGDTYFRLSPVPVQGPAAPFTWINSGQYFSCGSVSTGGSYCWGQGGEGSLGNGHWEDVSVPTLVDLPEPIRQGTAGWNHACGLTEAGKAYCWGRNQEQQLGDGTNTVRPSPVQVAGGYSFEDLGAGDSHTCGVTLGGQTLCWGWNGYGQVGTGETGGTFGVPTPVSMPDGVSFTYVSGGYYHTCARSSDAQVWCWGRNNQGQLGDGTTDNSPVPVLVQELPPVTRIAVGGFHACALDEGGKAYCWGRGALGRLGYGGEEMQVTPQQVAGGHEFRSLFGAGARTCGITGDHRTFCWGYNRYGALGLGEETGWAVLEPTEVAGGHAFASMAEGFSDSVACGVTTSGIGYCWGSQQLGELGIGVLGYEPLPVAVLGGVSFRLPQESGVNR